MRIDRLHARYPFLEGAREAVAAGEVDLATVVAEEPPVVERATERVLGSIEDGTVGEPRRDARAELLSYPVARVLVSLGEAPVLVRRYAQAEAEAAHERFSADLEDTTELKSVETAGVDLDTLLREFDLDGDVRAVDEERLTNTEGRTAATSSNAVAVVGDTEYRVAVGTYLPLASGLWGDEWRLVNRALSDGDVPVDGDELLTLLGEAVRSRVEDGLPFDVPDAIADELDGEVERIGETVAELDLTREIDTVVPDLFPPCMKALLDAIQKGEHLPHHSRFAITAFLANIGLETDEIVDLYRVNSSFGEEMTRYQTDHIRGDTSPTEYTPPACATMQSYGDCVNKDDLCERISHPLGYYERRLDDADEDDLEDWREGDETGDDGAKSDDASTGDDTAPGADTAAGGD